MEKARRSSRSIAMPTTTASRGSVGKLVAGADSVEIKATITHDRTKRGLKHFGLGDKNAEKRFIYFFDTPKLALFRAGIIARARRIIDKQHDSTIKIRPVQAEKVPAKWRKESGFKIEADASEKGIVLSASLTKPVAKGMIKDVEEEKARLTSLLGKTQELFLAEMAIVRYDLAALAVLGPMQAWCWKFNHPGLPWPVTAELWKRGDGATILEVSTRVPVAQAAVANAGFFAFLAELGAERDNAQQTKTRWALDYYAGKLPRSAKGGTSKKAR
jgi:hypothetical protein